MTAEIGVMNRIGVALAADSAVTISGDTNKIYTSADKLFHLSSTAPVGAMFYGNAGLVQIPWETIIKTYRRTLGRTTFNTVEEYATHLIKFLGQRHGIFSRELQIGEAEARIRFWFCEIRDRIFEHLRKKKELEGETPQEDEVRNITSRIIRKVLTNCRKETLIKGVSKNIRESLRKKLGPRIVSIRQDVFQQLPMTASASRNVVTFAVEALFRHVFSSLSSGIVVAGFGEKQYTPALIVIEIDGLIEGKPRYQIVDKVEIDDNTSSSIMPFAQKEMVHTFMEGIEPNLNRMVHSSTRTLFSGIAGNIIDEVKKYDAKFGKRLEKKVAKATKKLITELFNSWAEQRERFHWGPITVMVSSLPKDELAAMAESLVNLTKFRRRVSTDEETVGGPIDVAVITKGDGFIWVKRKHYFDPGLNPRTMGRYVKEVSY